MKEAKGVGCPSQDSWQEMPQSVAQTNQASHETHPEFSLQLVDLRIVTEAPLCRHLDSVAVSTFSGNPPTPLVQILEWLKF